MYRIKMLIGSATVIALAACSDIAGIDKSAVDAPVRLDGAPAVSSPPILTDSAAIDRNGTLGSGYDVTTSGNGTLGSGY